MSEQTKYTTCPLCEATCGLEIVTKGREVISIKGNEQDVFSHGYICPKAYSLKELDADPDRLRNPMVRHGDNWQEVSWDEAFAEVERGLNAVIQKYGRDAIATFLGNPNVHNLSGAIYLPFFAKALGSRNVFSASTVDQMPKQITSALMFGSGLSIPIPDIDHTDYLLMLGANPLVSNGSLMTAPDMRGRIRNLRKRGGKLVVMDPVRTRTAEEADEHFFIRPGGDAAFLFGVAHTLFAENMVAPGRLLEHTNGLDEIRELAQHFAPETVESACGISAENIRRIARELAAAKKAAVYGRMGTSTQEFGTLASWLIDVVNFLTGNLDREGGALFTKGAIGATNTRGVPGKGRGFAYGRWKTRVRGLPEFFGELPSVCLAEEMLTPGEGQIHALFTVAGNPVLSTPDSGQLQKALDGLDFMVSVDIYLNETTRHANVILPPLSPLERSHYDIAFYQLSIQNIAHYSAPIFEKTPGALAEWEIMLKLAAIASGQGAAVPIPQLDEYFIKQAVKREVETVGSSVHGRQPEELLAALAHRSGPERHLDFMLRSGPYGDAFGANPGGLTLEILEASPNGIDLGPLQPRIPEVLRTASGKIELAPPLLVSDVARLQESLRQPLPDMVLIGRRNLRSNNSWMHNLNVLVKGKEACTLLINPADATKLELSDGETVSVVSRTGEVSLPVEISGNIAPGVVSIPHGWGHSVAGTRMQVASAHAGVNTNILTDGEKMDVISGNAALNGVPVKVHKVAAVAV